jgi:hypothetical protein
VRTSLRPPPVAQAQFEPELARIPARFCCHIVQITPAGLGSHRLNRQNSSSGPIAGLPPCFRRVGEGLATIHSRTGWY